MEDPGAVSHHCQGSVSTERTLSLCLASVRQRCSQCSKRHGGMMASSSAHYVVWGKAALLCSLPSVLICAACCMWDLQCGACKPQTTGVTKCLHGVLLPCPPNGIQECQSHARCPSPPTSIPPLCADGRQVSWLSSRGKTHLHITKLPAHLVRLLSLTLISQCNGHVEAMLPRCAVAASKCRSRQE